MELSLIAFLPPMNGSDGPMNVQRHAVVRVPHVAGARIDDRHADQHARYRGNRDTRAHRTFARCRRSPRRESYRNTGATTADVIAVRMRHDD